MLMKSGCPVIVSPQRTTWPSLTSRSASATCTSSPHVRGTLRPFCSSRSFRYTKTDDAGEWPTPYVLPSHRQRLRNASTRLSLGIESARSSTGRRSPFAAKGLLRPVDDLADSIPKDNLVDAFRNLCRWDGRTYGVGHSPASSVFVYRKDLLEQKGLKVPRTWGELVQVADALREVKDGQVVRWGLTMTGQPLFINIAVGELLKTNGGRLFDAEGRPTLTERPVIELLDFYKQLNRVLPPGWTGHGYLDTFANLANGKAAMLYQAYGRGVGYIEKYAPKEIADPDHFAVADKMVGPSGKTPAAQLDCEPWMVFKDAKGGNEAVDFLRFFFRDENYIPYLHSVPIHLLPIKKSTYRNPRYADNATIRKWRSWVDMQEKYFRNDWIKPVLVTDWDDMTKPYLLEVMGSGILADMVLDSVKGMPSAEAAARAQKRVEELLASSGYLKK